MDDIHCPRCKTTKYRNPSLKLMVNVCGHALCDNCVEYLFVRGSGLCPECGVNLRKNNFRVQIFEDHLVEKDVDIRRKILRDYNKKEEDFKNLREYNDYLEEIETIVFNLTNNIDVEETKARIDQYKKDNQDQIRKNRTKLSREEEMLEEMIELEKQEAEYYRKQAAEEQQRNVLEKRRNKEALIDELMASDLPADHILAQHKKEPTQQDTFKAPQRHSKFSTGISMSHKSIFDANPVSTKTEGEPYHHEAIMVDMCGPPPPRGQELHEQGYLDQMRVTKESELAGGYMTTFGCQRALLDALCGLFYTVPLPDTGQSATAGQFMVELT